MLFVRPRDERSPVASSDGRRLALNLAAMTRLHELSMALGQVGDFKVLLERILDAAIELTGASKGYIQFVAAPDGRTRLLVQRGLGPRLAEHLKHQVLAGTAGASLPAQRRNLIEDILQAPALKGTGDLEWMLADGIRGLATVAITTLAGERLGILSLQFPQPHQLTEDELRFLDLAAGMAGDFIERTEAGRALRESEERFRALLSTGAYLIFRMSADWSAMTELAGDFGGASRWPNPDWLTDFVHPDDLNRVRERIAEVRASGATFDLEHRLHLPDGRVRWMHSRAVPLRALDGRVREWFGAATDITERKDAEEKLQSYQTQLEDRVMERTAELDGANGMLRDEIIERGRAHRAHEDVLRQLADAQEAERRRISRELHDEVGQQLAALLLAINEMAERHHIPWQAEELRQVQAIAQTIATEIHDLAVELRPTSLDDLGLARALAAYAEFWAERAGVKIDFHASGFEERRLPGPLETAVYRIVQEALTNVKKHAHARTVSVIIELKGRELSAIVEDDGVGFDASTHRGAERLGVLGMTERAALVGGELRVESNPGAGTTVMLRIPLEGTGPGSPPGNLTRRRAPLSDSLLRGMGPRGRAGPA